MSYVISRWPIHRLIKTNNYENNESACKHEWVSMDHQYNIQIYYYNIIIIFKTRNLAIFLSSHFFNAFTLFIKYALKNGSVKKNATESTKSKNMQNSSTQTLSNFFVVQ